jgi:hypothetical protein
MMILQLRALLFVWSCASEAGNCSGGASAQYPRIAPVFDFIQSNFAIFAAPVRRFCCAG